ncbi:MAG: hypothetical protein N5P05_001456 [Chroococcopsis gigantea SAG 12.99]|jgi:ferredoxin|nr:ferredoxin [Chlorogloea purpurea SAG 13.99]MDV2999850.1 hypothetical protein [Chroococcopsis gigantea SAG 12.99]
MADLSANFIITPDRSGLEPELGGILRDSTSQTGLEPELGGSLRDQAAYVDEATCIGCLHCAHVAPNTFFIEEDFGRSRVFNQNGDNAERIQEAMDTCPVDCIHWVDYSELKELEEARKEQVIKQIGCPQDNRKPKLKRRKSSRTSF